MLQQRSRDHGRSSAQVETVSPKVIRRMRAANSLHQLSSSIPLDMTSSQATLSTLSPPIIHVNQSHPLESRTYPLHTSQKALPVTSREEQVLIRREHRHSPVINSVLFIPVPFNTTQPLRHSKSVKPLRKSGRPKSIKKSYLERLKAKFPRRRRPDTKQKVIISEPSNPIHSSHSLDRATTFTSPPQTDERQPGNNQNLKRPREAAWPLRQHPVEPSQRPSSQAPSSPIPVYRLEITPAPNPATVTLKSTHLTANSAWKVESDKARRTAIRLQKQVDKLNADLFEAKSEQDDKIKLKGLELLQVIEKLTAKCEGLENGFTRQQAEAVRYKADAERYQRLYEAQNAKLTELLSSETVFRSQAPYRPETEQEPSPLTDLSDETATELPSQSRKLPAISRNIIPGIPEEYWTIDGAEEIPDPYDSSGFLIDEAFLFSESAILPGSMDGND